ncbi:hypothetical protein JXA80_10135 [bacterium]|nr:hypothetical protein [candidate division CSSED10-310 bacterium]
MIESRTVHTYHPGMFRIDGIRGKYPALSLTGTVCELNCRHCRGRLLKGMMMADTPDLLRERLIRAHLAGFPGALISGGADIRGSLPWTRFLPVIESIANTTNLMLSVHLGLADRNTVEALARSGVRLFLFDFVTRPDTFRTVFGLSDGYTRMQSMIDALIDLHVWTAPHIILGFTGDDISTEIENMDRLVPLLKTSIVVIQFMPLRNTPMAGDPTASRDTVIRYITDLRKRFPQTEIALGCARRRPDATLEIQAIRAGIDRLALPDPITRAFLDTEAIPTIHHPVCCAIHHADPMMQKGPTDGHHAILP